MTEAFGRGAARPDTLSALTGLRFLAALSVLLGHAFSDLVKFNDFPQPLWASSISQLPGIGMPLFFVLSGFVIHYNYYQSIATAPIRGTYNFIVARFARLYPLYIFVVLLDLFRFYFFENLSNPVMAEKLYSGLPSYLTLTQTWHYQIIADHSLVFTFPAMTTITWSVSTEWFFYLLYPFACVALARLRRPRPILLAIAVVILAGYASVCWAAANFDAINAYGINHHGEIARYGGADGFPFWLMYLSPFPHLLDFALGSLTAALFIALRNRPVSRKETRLGRWGLAVAIGGIAIAYAILFVPLGQLPAFNLRLVLAMYFGFTPFVALLLFCCTRYRSRVSAALSGPWILLGGEISYSIYLLHIGVVQFVQIFNQLANNATPPYTGWNIAHGLVAVALVTATVIGVSLVSYNIIEVPARRWLRRWLSLRPARVVPVAPNIAI